MFVEHNARHKNPWPQSVELLNASRLQMGLHCRRLVAQPEQIQAQQRENSHAYGLQCRHETSLWHVIIMTPFNSLQHKQMCHLVRIFGLLGDCSWHVDLAMSASSKLAWRVSSVLINQTCLCAHASASQHAQDQAHVLCRCWQLHHPMFKASTPGTIYHGAVHTHIKCCTS